ncbi:MAG: RNA polymerase factor sigma-32 [Gammaproteobacteria bacterium RIFCSPLOWO2_02_FULL_42_14]|nr:MAG: RNA polymerase factor sigma-32 [Gammaproteobacteria bacterium RIFCSPHIGHO2_02_FULL_42_43]OGT28541.1 MAG: RNA polymerase factor sigma-32 [Gammaproteobacteria bacterium RIFCSPHIGHO2_01_FULL_42_8]OGT51446.1 MAG: RNA polymerase factor sigma-32 [Gammaproteobacteria bacterium RIFCSPHIGHO2_12_FULL_41_25]OGT62148.1 MAG: RNA polymerase factor sigma-32 [Gammaproteobacteria bacterium RIFCSPLOWO2_02_FULL_42_14]OGT85820.1 MAG: RNA polymerase factor sigma-32 [Gammaproteobacteria bacterium RIFCSPLOWO2
MKLADQKALALATGSLSVGTLGSYIHWVNQIPLLTESEEKALAERLHQNNDLKAARELVMSHLRFVVKIARGYAGYGLQQEDLIQEGNIGLMKAVKRFNPTMGVRLVSFAVHWIRAEMHEFIIRNWRIVKIATTKAQRKLFFNIRKAAKKRGWFSDSEIAAVAEELNVSHQDVRQMEMRMSNADQSLEFFGDDDDETASLKAPIHYLEDKSANPEQQAQADNLEAFQGVELQHAMKKLDARSQTIIQERWLSEEKSTLQTLAAQFNISLERVRQLEKMALEKLRMAMAA